jgi:ankyrin repeat protein
MLSHDADTNFKDEEGYTVIHYLAASWQYEPLRTILDHENFKCNIYSYSTSGMTALHHAADSNPLKLAIGEGTRILNNNRKCSAGASDESGSPIQDNLEELLLEDGIPTLKVLLEAGSRPNVRDTTGRTVLQLIVESEDVWGHRFGDAIDTLLYFGARLSDESPQNAVIRESPQCSIEDAQAEWNSELVVDADYISLIKSPMGQFKDLEDSIVPGQASLRGSSSNENLTKKKDEKEKTCNLCDFKFTLFRRQHHCRLCDSVCCEDCGKKKAIVESQQVLI